MSTNTITLSVPDMSCGHCESAVKAEVGTVAGVESVAVNLDTDRRATVSDEQVEFGARVGGPKPRRRDPRQGEDLFDDETLPTRSNLRVPEKVVVIADREQSVEQAGVAHVHLG